MLAQYMVPRKAAKEVSENLWSLVKTYQYLIMGTIPMDQGACICNVHVHILMTISCKFFFISHAQFKLECATCNALGVIYIMHVATLIPLGCCFQNYTYMHYNMVESHGLLGCKLLSGGHAEYAGLIYRVMKIVAQIIKQE